MFTKQDVLATKEEPAYLDLDGIEISGQAIAKHLQNEGFTILYCTSRTLGQIGFRDEDGISYNISTSGKCHTIW